MLCRAQEIRNAANGSFPHKTSLVLRCVARCVGRFVVLYSLFILRFSCALKSLPHASPIRSDVRGFHSFPGFEYSDFPSTDLLQVHSLKELQALALTARRIACEAADRPCYGATFFCRRAVPDRVEQRSHQRRRTSCGYLSAHRPLRVWVCTAQRHAVLQ
jgi:hypothetical protein